MTLKHQPPKSFEDETPAVTARKAGRAPSGSHNPRHIQSVSRALDILETLARERDGLSLSELADEVGLNSSTCHHLIATLVSRGYVLHLGRARGYAMGPRVHELVNLADSELDPSELLKNDLRELGLRLGHGVQLAVLAETSLLTKLRFPGPDADDGFEEPDELTKMSALHATATGKAILAWLPEIELVRVISANGLSRYTDKTITTLSGLVEDLRLVRRRGFSVDDEELKDGVVCIGAALRDSGGAIIGSISASAAAKDMPSDYRAELSRKMTSAALDFSKRLRSAKR